MVLLEAIDSADPINDENQTKAKRWFAAIERIDGKVNEGFVIMVGCIFPMSG